MTVDSSKYPQHAKLEARNGQNNIIGEFMEWLRENGYTICEFDAARWSGQGEYYPAMKSIDKIIAQYFGVDIDAFNRERYLMLEEFQDAVRGEREAEARRSGGAGGDQPRGAGVD